jgi:hypothetical protein
MSSKKRVLLEDPENQPEEPSMEFRLTYLGPLFATQNDPVGGQRDRRAENKKAIRKVFHRQLKRLWSITPFLKMGRGSGPDALILSGEYNDPVYDVASLSTRHVHYGFNFVPLVTQELNLICGLDILFLRPDLPGSVVQSGDVDNRLKTLFDALSIPTANERYVDTAPSADEKPFFCLLENDRLITKISVETDQLLDLPDNNTQHEVALIITVRLRPYEMHLGNMQFG